MATVTRERIDVYEHVTDRIVEQLEAGTVPWRKTWASMGGVPRNLTSKKRYRGVNLFLLSLSGYESPYWLTFKQALDMGGHVKRGEKSTLVVFWRMLEVIDRETGKPVKVPMLRHYRVFNSAQCELGNKQPEAELPQHDVDPIAACEAVVDAMPRRPAIEHGGGQPCYVPSLDVVRMPERSRFETAEAYHATMFHELSHATGHKSRLDRAGITELAAFGSATYSREELVAEMGAAFLCAHTGIENATIENSAAYIAGWLKQLRNDKKLVVQAAGQAQRAADFILGTTFGEESGNESEALQQ